MMHIIDISCISPQDTYGSSEFNPSVKKHSGHFYLAEEPEYKSFIARGALRRMGKASRLGIGAGIPLIKNHPNLNGIILSTGNGGLGDCGQFLSQIIQYEEGSLTPTQFVNSTSNSVAGSLALTAKNNEYNATFVGHGFGFESALLDALMQLEDKPNSTFLVGNTDEISEFNTNIEKHRGSLKNEETNSESLLKSTTTGTVIGEGASMFLVSNQAEKPLATIIDVGMIQTTEFSKLETAIISLLKRNDLTATDIGSLILGFNGDGIGDDFYHQLVGNHFKDAPILSFKNLVGDYPTVSGFALWLAAQTGKIPSEAVYKKGVQKSNYVLIYNHYQNEQHGFILVKRPSPLQFI